MVSDAPEFMAGTASWTDKTLIETASFYPPDVKTAEDRLRFYAAQFRTVEVDSTYYAISAEHNAEVWRDRTPPGFIFNIKAFAWLTQHETAASRLPKEIKQMLSASHRDAARLRCPSLEALDLAFEMFWNSIRPLRIADPSRGGSLGMLLFQFPPYFICKASNMDYIARLQERMPGALIAIEFRHRSWTGEEKQRADTLDFLRRHGLYFVSIDAPEDKSIPPSLVDATGDQAYVRFHGRNRDAWYGKHGSAADRFKYLYAERELAEKAAQLKALGQHGVKRAFVIFNNCYQNFGILNAGTMANMLKH
jgi:uncharacterized protein YecE (DUF72 family)